MLAGSSFDCTRTHSPDSESGGILSRWSAWGRGARTGFSGVDARWGRWTGVVALAHSLGEGSDRADAGGGALASTLTSLNPYGGVAVNDRLSLWGVRGYGAGELTLTPDSSDTGIRTDLTNAMAAFGARGVFARRAGGLELAVVSDAMFTNTDSSAAAGLMGGCRCRSMRGRFSRTRTPITKNGATAARSQAQLGGERRSRVRVRTA